MSEYEEMTPYEFMLANDAYLEKQKLRQEEEMSIAWLTAYLHRVDKMPELYEVLGKEPPSRTMNDEQMLEQVKKLNVQFNGEINIKAGEKIGDT